MSDSAILWTVTHQAPIVHGDSPGKNTGGGLPFPPPGDLPDPGIKLASLLFPALAGRVFTTAPPAKPAVHLNKL